MVEDSSEGLKGDPRRQAVPSLKGYAYQIWHSVYTWITLGKDDVLYLEGAEDLDVLGPEKAETIQVKDTKRSGPVTLRSSDVLEAIGHFWKLQERNSHVTIFFRFLTTAKRGRERGAPFGTTCGLDYWDRCKRPGVDLHPLRTFLQSQQALPDTLREFIASSDDDTFRNHLVSRIDWDTGSEPKEYIEDLVNNEVAHYGLQCHQLPLSESLKVVPHLLKHVWDVVCRDNDRRLRHLDFMGLFENATTERVNRQELRRLRQLSASVSPEGALLAYGTAGMGSFPRIQGMDLHTSPPPLPDRVARRRNLVATLSQQVQTNGLLVLKGSTGMGKSTLAALIAHADTQEWTWLRMRGQKPDQIRELLYQAALIHPEQSPEVRVVLDDLNFGSHTAQYEGALTGALYAILSRGGQVIVTTQGDLPSRVTSRFPMAAAASTEVPPLALDDIKQMVLDHGCPSEDKQHVWTVVIWAKTRGHPQLVHATVRKFEATGWPMPGSGDGSEAEDIEAVRREARSALQEQLPSEEAKSLAYRLSILGQPFRRDHALQLGTHPPALAFPGAAFDLLVGPWIERVDQTYYSVSPLLDEAAKAMWPPQHITALHKAAAEAFLSCRRLTPLEASGVLRHALASGAMHPILVILVALEKLPEEAWPAVAQQFLWLAAVALTPGEKIFPVASFISTMLRCIQFRIAVEINSDILAPLVSDAWEHELESIEIPELKPLMRLTFLARTVIYFQAPCSQRTIVARAVEAIHLAKENINLPHPKHSGESDDLPWINALKSQFLLFAIPRCESTHDLDEFLSALEEQPAEIRAEVLLPFREDAYWANLLCSKVWFNEAHTSSPQWTRCIQIFERTVHLGLSWGIAPLVASAYHALAVIHDEYLDDPQAALTSLAQGEAQLGQGQPVLENARAMVLYRRQQYKEALHIWEAVLPQWQQDRDATLAFSYRKAEICAIEDNDWRKATEMALRGEEAAHRTELAGMAVGFRADYAFALWRCNDTAGAIASFVTVLEALPKLPDPQNDMYCYALHVRVDYALTWILQDLRGKQTHSEPPFPACFSDSEVDESYKNFPIRPIGLLWNTLANIEFETKSGNAVFKRLEEENRNTSMPELELLIEYLRIGHSLRSFEMDILISSVSKLMKISDAFRRKIIEGKFKLKDGELPPELLITPDHLMQISLLVDLLFAALIILVSRGLQRSIPLEKWRIDANQLGFHHPKLEDWFSFIAESSQKSLSQLIAVMCNSGEREGEKRLLATLFITASEVVNPEDRFYADVLLVIAAHSHIWRREIEDEIEGLVSKGWSRAASEQSFALRTPKIHAPAILTACHDSARGLKKAAKILLAVNNAVRLRVTEQILTQLSNLAQE